MVSDFPITKFKLSYKVIEAAENIKAQAEVTS